MKKLFQKYLTWANTWSQSQIIFLIIIIVAFWATLGIMSNQLDKAHELIQTLQTK